MSVYVYNKDNRLVSFRQPFIFHCNCPGVVNKTDYLLREARLSVPKTSPVSDKIVKDYIMRVGLYDGIVVTTNPQTRRVTSNKYSILLNPKTGEYVDIVSRLGDIEELPRNMTSERVKLRNLLIEEMREVCNV
jgi:hypothetical protein